jgi:hypothetical protein
MIVEFGNHACALPEVDERPKVTQVQIPDYDDGSTHDDALYQVGAEQKTLADLGRSIPAGATLLKPGPQLGGHSYEPGGLSAQQFKEHVTDARLFNQGITQLPGHEALLAVEGAWPKNGTGRPAWVKCYPGLREPAHAADIESVLSDFYGCPTLQDYLRVDNDPDAQTLKEAGYWTPNGPPGVIRTATLPDLTALYTDDGRAMNNLNDGGDANLVAANSQGVGSAATATVLTTTSTLVGTTNLPGHRIILYTLSGNVFAWGNIISNTSGANGTITVDQWYVPATPGGSAAANPGTPWAWVVLDGGFVSTWFAAIGTGGSGWAHGDHTIAVASGSAEYTQAGGTMIRKQCPTAVTSGVASRTVTLVPVFTANSTDVPNLPKVVSVFALFASMVVSFGGAGGPMKWIDAVSPTATLAALNDQLTLTWVETGS